MAEGQQLCRNIAHQDCDTTLQHGSSVLQHDLRYGRARSRHGLGHDTILFHDRGQKAASLRHGAPARACAQRHRRGLLRHDLEGATTQSRVRHDTAHLAPRLSATCALPGRSGRAAWVRVCTWCTQPSFDSVHSFESLFRTLFMSTVNKVFKKKKIK